MQRQQSASSMGAPTREACPGCGQQGEAPRCEHCGVARSAGGFQVLRVLHQGPNGRMYLAQDADGRQVALKELLFTVAANVQQIDAFEREAALLQRLHHPQVPRFIRYFREGEGVGLRFYLAQAYVEGESLLQRLDTHRFQESEAVDIARQVLGILVALHGHEPHILHRDIKPANLLRRSDGQLVLVDFGAARELERGSTHRNTLVGTFGYMPPEQLGGTADETSDLYSLGATLLHLLSRKPPQELLTPRMELAFEGQVHVSWPFAAFLRRLVALPREERFASAAEALRALEGPKRGHSRSPRRTLRLAGAGVLLLGGYLALWPSLESWLLGRGRPPHARVRVGTPGRQQMKDDSNCNDPESCAPMCEQGRASACGKLASMYTHGLGIEPDAAKALALEERACALDSPKNCVFLGYKLRDGKLGPRDLPRARQLFEQGCKAGVSDGCSALADLEEVPGAGD